MEEQTSWKGHTFTLLIFGGIVVLCSIFFVLGMLVGRTQGQKLASVAAADAAAKNAQKGLARDERPEMTYYESVDKSNPRPSDPAPKPASVPTPQIEKPVVDPPPPPAPSGHVVNIQIGAMSTRAAAERMLAEATKSGFHAFMVTPGADEKSPLYRVQVGPISDPIEVESVKQKLTAKGYSFTVK